ncbi:hypothetical protein ACFW88_00340 [Streptomyces anandii]|uniref:Uncharacterized protein n=1 Tax=Streptomyces anandii TaxID=285454 RepID=A0ABW6GYA2_9ACTN
MSEPHSEDPMVAALLREREGLVQRGLTDRVAQVDEQLRLRGHTPPDSDGDTARPASRSTPPKGRRAKRAETA